jgi:hypothetical protein
VQLGAYSYHASIRISIILNCAVKLNSLKKVSQKPSKKHPLACTGALGVEIASVSYLFFRLPAKQRNEFLMASCSTSIVNAILTITVSATVSDATLRNTLQWVLNILVMGEILLLTVKVWRDNHMPEDWHFRQTVVHYGLCCLPIIVAGFICAARFPESLSLGTFDVLGSSHQLFHVSVIVSSVAFHYATVVFWTFLLDLHILMQQYSGGLDRSGSQEFRKRGDSACDKCTIEMRPLDSL